MEHLLQPSSGKTLNPVQPSSGTAPNPAQPTAGTTPTSPRRAYQPRHDANPAQLHPSTTPQRLITPRCRTGIGPTRLRRRHPAISSTNRCEHPCCATRQSHDSQIASQSTPNPDGTRPPCDASVTHPRHTRVGPGDCVSTVTRPDSKILSALSAPSGSQVYQACCPSSSTSSDVSAPSASAPSAPASSVPSPDASSPALSISS